ncbi:MAG TPA: flippase [Verrucomicrobiae bacterium]|nr:flippase [Verrucomicrobiae bacterium]
MTTVRGLLRDIAIVSGGQAITWVATFVFVLAQARFLGPVRFGELSLGLSYAAFFAIVVDFGVATHVTRAVAQARSDDRTILWSALTARAGLWLIVMPIAYVLTVVLGYDDELQATILVLTDSLLFVGLAGALNAYYQGRERFALPAIANAVQRVAAAVVGIVLLLAGFGVVAVAAVYAVSGAVAVALLVIGLRGTGLAAPRFDPRAVRGLLRAALPIGLYWVVGTFYFNVDMALIERLTPRESLGQYAAAYRLFSAASIIPAIVCGTVLYPLFARLTGASISALRPAVEKTIAYLALIGVLVSVVFASLAMPITGLLYPLPAYEPAASALRLLAPGLLFLYVNSVIGSALFALHMEKRLLVIAALAAILNTTANLLTIPVFGIEAAAAITSLTELFLLCCLVLAAPPGLVGSASGFVLARAALVGGLTAVALLPLGPAPIAVSAPIAALVFGVGCLLFQAFPADDLRLAGAHVRERIGALRSPRTS